MYTHAITHTPMHTTMHTNYCEFLHLFLPTLNCMQYAFMNLIFITLSLSLSSLSHTHTHTHHTHTHTHTHTHVQTAFSLACIDFKIIFSFTTYSRQNIMTIGLSSCSHRVDESLQINALAQRESIQMPHSALLVIQSNWISIQSCEFKLMHKTGISHKTLAIKHRFHTMSQREQNRHFLINLHYK